MAVLETAARRDPPCESAVVFSGLGGVVGVGDPVAVLADLFALELVVDAIVGLVVGTFVGFLAVFGVGGFVGLVGQRRGGSAVALVTRGAEWRTDDTEAVSSLDEVQRKESSPSAPP